MRRAWIPLFAALALVLAVLSPLAARAATRAPELVVLADGAGAGRVGDAVRGALLDRCTLGDADALRAQLRSDWHGVNLADALASPRRGELLEDVGRAARAAGADAVIVARVEGSKRARVARLAVIDPRGFVREVETRLAVRANPTDDTARLRAALDGPLASLARAAQAPEPTAPAAAPPAESRLFALRAAPAPSAAPDAAGAPAADPPAGDPPAPDAPAAAPSAPRSPLRTVLAVAPHVALGVRHFSYADRVTAGQREYDLGGAPLLGASVEAYPGALTGVEALGVFGVSAAYAHSLGLQSSTPDDELSQLSSSRVDTSWSTFDVALRARFPLGARVLGGAHLGYGGVDYAFSDAGVLAAQLPSVSYRFVRAGADARVTIWRLAAVASFDYLAITSAGEVADRYPRASVGGLEASAGVVVPLTGHLEARTELRYQRFFYAMHPRPGDPYVAGGALDQMEAWDTSVAYVF